MTQTHLPGTERHRLLSMAEVVRLSGASRSQIQYWLGKQIIAAPKRKHAGRGAPGHCFDLVEALTVTTIRDLRERGMPIADIAALLSRVRVFFRGALEQHRGRWFLVSDSKRVEIAENFRLGDVLTGMARATIVELSRQIERINDQ